MINWLKLPADRIMIALIWIAFVAYTLQLAPLDHAETWPMVKHLLTFQLSQVNAYLFAIFWMMGVWPMIYAAVMFADGRLQKLPAWLYFLASNGTGMLSLAPYLILRQPNPSFAGCKDSWLALLDAHRLGIILSLITLGLLTYALAVGDWQEFLQQWRSLPFVHLITLDFCLMALLFPTLLEDDMARREVQSSTIFWAVALLPLFGPLVYLCLRPPLPPVTPPLLIKY